MPKQGPPVASEKELDDWLKSRGYDFKDGTIQPPQPATPVPKSDASAATPPTTTTTDEGPGYGESLARGLGKSMVSTATGAGQLAGQLVPTSVRKTLGQLAESVPGVKRAEEFSREPYQSFTEGAGGLAGDVATGLMMPELGIARAAKYLAPSKQVATTVPMWVNPLGAGGRWMLANTTRSVQNPQTVERLGKAGQIVENAAKGAVGGAATSPDDPLSGAAYGAAGGLTQRGLGELLRSKYGQTIGDLIFRYVPASVAGGLVGYATHGMSGAVTGAGSGAGALHMGRQIAHGLQHATRGSIGYHGTPVGRKLGGAGAATSRGIGHALGYVDPVTGGILAERGRRTLGKTDLRDVYERTKESVNPTDYSNTPPYQGDSSGEPRSPASE